MEGLTGKKRKILAGNTRDVLCLVQSIPSRKAISPINASNKNLLEIKSDEDK